MRVTYTPGDETKIGSTGELNRAIEARCSELGITKIEVDIIPLLINDIDTYYQVHGGNELWSAIQTAAATRNIPIESITQQIITWLIPHCPMPTYTPPTPPASTITSVTITTTTPGNKAIGALVELDAVVLGIGAYNPAVTWENSDPAILELVSTLGQHSTWRVLAYGTVVIRARSVQDTTKYGRSDWQFLPPTPARPPRIIITLPDGTPVTSGGGVDVVQGQALTLNYRLTDTYPAAQTYDISIAMTSGDMLFTATIDPIDPSTFTGTLTITSVGTGPNDEGHTQVSVVSHKPGTSDYTTNFDFDVRTVPASDIHVYDSNYVETPAGSTITLLAGDTLYRAVRDLSLPDEQSAQDQITISIDNTTDFMLTQIPAELHPDGHWYTSVVLESLVGTGPASCTLKVESVQIPEWTCEVDTPAPPLLPQDITMQRYSDHSNVPNGSTTSPQGGLGANYEAWSASLPQYSDAQIAGITATFQNGILSVDTPTNNGWHVLYHFSGTGTDILHLSVAGHEDYTCTVVI